MKTGTTRLLVALACLVLASCGGGGGGGSPGSNSGGSNPPNPPGPSPTAIALDSEPGDFVGQGQSYSYSQADALITVQVDGAHLTVRIEGDESWRGEFILPNTYTALTAGTYANLTRYPFHDPVVGGLSWTGESRGCNVLSGTFTINEVVYDGPNLVRIDLQFEQYCENGAAALRGDIYWDANDATSPPGPAVPPVGLWEPGAGVTPSSGNYVYLESEPGDFVGQGDTYLYTSADAVLMVSDSSGHLSVTVNGNQSWFGDFQVMNSISFVEVGYYPGLQRYPFHNPVRGGLDWFGEGRGCNVLTGWFVVDSVTYDGNDLTAIDLRFEQHCEGGAPALRGEIHWDASDPTAPPGPVPPPAGLWEPAPGTTPESGSFVYLESEPGDYIGAGRNYSYTLANSLMTASTTGNRLTVSIEGDEWWTGNFQAMLTLERLEVGYYGDLQNYPFHNPATGGLDWSGEGRGCNSVEGWFVVDSVTYDGPELMAIELRFEQHCSSNVAALNGAIRWDATDTTAPPGPVVPVPDGLWEPPPAAVPESGTFLFIEAESGNLLYTQLDSRFIVGNSATGLSIGVYGDEDWVGRFQAMSSIDTMTVGYYGDLGEFPFHNPTVGGLAWSGEGITTSCRRIGWWVAIDSLTYDGAELVAAELRFGERCDGGGPAFHGAFRWDANDPTTPPGPVSPPPAGLWEPAPGTTPGSGDYVYLASDDGDYIGQGQQYLYTPNDAQITVNASGGNLAMQVFGTEDWRATFQTMNVLNRFEVGYYGDLQRYPFHNQTKGGLTWTGESRGCNQVSGWFVVDSVVYVGADLDSISLRFEQHCENRVPALRGVVFWTRQ